MLGTWVTAWLDDGDGGLEVTGLVVEVREDEETRVYRLEGVVGDTAREIREEAGEFWMLERELVREARRAALAG